MADSFSEVDSEGVYVGMSLADFGVRVSRPTTTRAHAATRLAAERDERGVTTMPRDSLREAIDHLRGELASGEPLSAEERAQLDRVLGEVAGILEPDSAESEPGDGVIDELRDFTDRFEESHPELSLILGRIMDSLSQLGI
jgi:hypothetical protein